MDNWDFDGHKSIGSYINGGIKYAGKKVKQATKWVYKNGKKVEKVVVKGAIQLKDGAVGFAYAGVDNILLSNGRNLGIVVFAGSPEFLKSYLNGEQKFRDNLEGAVKKYLVSNEKAYYSGKIANDVVTIYAGFTVQGIGDAASIGGACTVQPEIVALGQGVNVAGVVLVGNASVNLAGDIKAITSSGSGSKNKPDATKHSEYRKNVTGRPGAQVTSDIRNANPSEVYIEDNGNIIVKGSNERVQVLSPDGLRHITPMRRTQANINKLVKQGRYRQATETEVKKLFEIYGNNYYEKTKAPWLQ